MILRGVSFSTLKFEYLNKNHKYLNDEINWRSKITWDCGTWDVGQQTYPSPAINSRQNTKQTYPIIHHQSLTADKIPSRHHILSGKQTTSPDSRYCQITSQDRRTILRTVDIGQLSSYSLLGQQEALTGQYVRRLFLDSMLPSPYSAW